MPRFQRTAVTALSVAAIAATALDTAPTASEAGYRCTTSKMTIDDPAYSGPLTGQLGPVRDDLRQALRLVRVRLRQD